MTLRRREIVIAALVAFAPTRSWAQAPAGPPSPTTPAAADATPPSPPPKSDYVEVRVIGDKVDSLQRTPGSGYLISAQDIERADPWNAEEMLRRVPGVQVRQSYDGGNRIDLSIRGIESGRSRNVLMLEDGIPIAVNPYSEPDMYFTPPMEMIRGIEVVKGSGAILFGPQTTGGVVNFVTLIPPPRAQSTIDVDAGQHAYLRALAQYGDTVGSARYIVQALHRRGDGFQDAGFSETNVFAKAAFETSAKGELTAKVGFFDNSNGSGDLGLTRAMFKSDPRRDTLTPNDAMQMRRYDLSLIHEERFNADTKLKTLAYAYVLTRIWRRQDWTRSPSTAADFERIVGDPALAGDPVYFFKTATILDRTYEVAGLEPRFEHRFRTGDVGHTLDFGGRFLVETALYDQGTADSVTSFAGTSDYRESHSAIAGAGYVQDRIALRDDLLLTPGARIEGVELTRNTERQNTGSGPTDVNQQGTTDATGFIPGIGLVYGKPKMHVFGGMHLGWAPPRITSAVSPRGVPAQLRPDRSSNYELGTRLNPVRYARVETTGFVSLYTNQTVAGGGDDSGTGLVNGGPTRIYGVEGAAVFGAGTLFHWPTIVDIGARYTYSHATFVGGQYSDRFLPYAPLHSFNANVDVEHPSGFGGQVAVAYVGEQFTDSANTYYEDAAGDLGHISAHAIVDVMAHYKNKRTGLTFRLSCKGCTDDVYIVARRPNGISPAGYRQIMAGVRWDYDFPRAQ
jgi:Fe(3+) dicitrate transport protein